MAHWVYRFHDGSFLGTRKVIPGGDPYEARSGTTPHLQAARVFTSKSAAVNAGRSLGGSKYGRRGDVPAGEAIHIQLELRPQASNLPE